MKYTQADLSEIMFHYHLDQAASHMQGMTVSLPMTHEVKKEFNFVVKAMNRIWKKQDSNLQNLSEEFADVASQMDAFLQLFLQTNDRAKLLETIWLQQMKEKDDSNEIIITRQLVDDQKRHLHAQV